jgi:hypothetical protein
MESKWLEDKTYGDHYKSLRGRVGFELERIDQISWSKKKTWIKK